MSTKKSLRKGRIVATPEDKKNKETERLLDKEKLKTLDEATKRAEKSAKNAKELIDNIPRPPGTKRAISSENLEEHLKRNFVGGYVQQIRGEEEDRKEKGKNRSK